MLLQKTESDEGEGKVRLFTFFFRSQSTVSEGVEARRYLGWCLEWILGGVRGVGWVRLR